MTAQEAIEIIEDCGWPGDDTVRQYRVIAFIREQAARIEELEQQTPSPN